MDLTMPVMNGFDSTRELRKMIKENKIKDLNIIATTADNITNSLSKKCLEAGFDDVISKPVKRKVLAKILKKYYKWKINNSDC